MFGCEIDHLIEHNLHFADYIFLLLFHLFLVKLLYYNELRKLSAFEKSFNCIQSLLLFQVHTTTGVIFEGIFRTFSAQFEVVVELAHKVDPSNPLQIHLDSIIEKIIFKAPDIIKLEIVDADIDYATRGMKF